VLPLTEWVVNVFLDNLKLFINDYDFSKY